MFPVSQYSGFTGKDEDKENVPGEHAQNYVFAERTELARAVRELAASVQEVWLADYVCTHSKRSPFSLGIWPLRTVERASSHNTRKGP